MLVSEFVKEYQQSKQKNAFIKKHIKTNYIPYITKIGIAQSIVSQSMYEEINGEKVFIKQSPIQYFLFVQNVIKQYTDIEWDKKENNKYDTVNGFDLLEENGLVENIFSVIGEDIPKFMTVLNIVVDDEIDKNRSMVAFLETKYEALSVFMNTIEKVLEDPHIKDKLINIINK